MSTSNSSGFDMRADSIHRDPSGELRQWGQRLNAEDRRAAADHDGSSGRARRRPEPCPACGHTPAQSRRARAVSSSPPPDDRRRGNSRARSPSSVPFTRSTQKPPVRRPEAGEAQPLIPAFVTTCPGAGRTTAGRSLQQRHKGCASPSERASSVAACSIPRANSRQVAGVPGGAAITEKIADGLLLRVPPHSQRGARVSGVRRIRSRHRPARPSLPRHGRLHRNGESGVARGGVACSGVLRKDSPRRDGPDRQRRARRRDGGRIGHRFVRRPRRHCRHRAGPGGPASAAGALEEEQAPGRGRNGRCPRRWRSDRCRAARHQVFQQPHTRSVTAGAGDRGHTPDSDHRLGVRATGHPGPAASRPSPSRDDEPAPEHHRRRTAHRDAEPTAECRRHGPLSRDLEHHAAHHTRVGRRGAHGRRRDPGPAPDPGPGDDSARFHRTLRHGPIGRAPAADHVGG